MKIFSALFGIALSLPAFGQENAYFPRPLEVEHRTVQTDLEGRFESDPVTDTYVGNSIVSQRAGGSRLVVDLERREMTEIDPRAGTYWTIGFERFAALREQVALLAGPRSVRDAAAVAGKAAGTAVEKRALTVAELAPDSGRRHFRVALSPAADALAGKTLSARESAVAETAWMEVEVDPEVRFSPAAAEALARYEADAFASTAEPGALPAEKALAAVRERSGRALALRTRRPLLSGARTIGSVETEVLAVREPASFDPALLRVPEGLRRRPHPYELIVQQLEQEERVNDALAGRAAGRP